MSATIKPCPMCGRDDSEDNACQQAAVELHQVATPIVKMGYEVQCSCGVKGPRDLDGMQAIAAWNRRADGWQPKVTDAAIAAAANVFSAHGLHISLPSEGDMDDLEHERYDGLRLALEAAFAAEAS